MPKWFMRHELSGRISAKYTQKYILLINTTYEIKLHAIVGEGAVSRGLRLSATIAVLAVWSSGSPVVAGDLVPPKSDQLPICERALAEKLTPRVTVNRLEVYKADCPGGGGPDEYSIDVTLPLAFLVQGVGSPADYDIESARQNIHENSGGPSFRFSYNAGVIQAGVSCSSGWFGGGVTGSFSVTAVLKERMNDRRAAYIARQCSALTYHPGLPK